MQILHDAGRMRAPFRRLRLLLLELLQLPRARVAGVLLEQLLQLLCACTPGAHHGARLGQLLTAGGGLLLRCSQGTRRLFQARRLLGSRGLPFREFRPHSGRVLLERGDALLEGGFVLLGMVGTLLSAHGTLLSAHGTLLGARGTLLEARGPLLGARRALCCRGLRAERLIARLLELHQALTMAREPLLRLVQRGSELIVLSFLLLSVRCGARRGTQGRPHPRRRSPGVGHSVMLIRSTSLDLHRQGGVRIVGRACGVQHRQLGGDVKIWIAARWRRRPRARTHRDSSVCIDEKV
jgi:hypothetical protein